MNLRHTVDHRNDVVLGEVGLAIRHRLRVIQASLPLRTAPLPPYISALIDPTIMTRSRRPSAAHMSATQGNSNSNSNSSATTPRSTPMGPLDDSRSYASAAALRLAFARSYPSPFMLAIARGVEGMALSVTGLKIQLPYRVHLGVAMDAAMNHVTELVTLIAASSGAPWHPTNSRHWQYFSRPPPSGFDLRGGVSDFAALNMHVMGPDQGQQQQQQQVGADVDGPADSESHPLGDRVAPVTPKIWLQCTQIVFSLQDDPWESWLGQACAQYARCEVVEHCPLLTAVAFHACAVQAGVAQRAIRTNRPQSLTGRSALPLT
jgi:hypothetical protein